MSDLKLNIIDSKCSAREALQTLNKIGKRHFQTLFVVDDENHLLGSLTDGDIRRGLLKGNEISNAVHLFINPDCYRINESDLDNLDIEGIRQKGIGLVPVLKGDVLDHILDVNEYQAKLPIDVLIMAGGKGKRLLPLTKDIPKPLLKVGDKSIIDYNIDALASCGVEEITISVNYLHQKIIDHCKERNTASPSFKFVKEEGPLGTAGALGLLNGNHKEHLLMMNSDLLTTINYHNFYKFFIEQDADIAIAAVPYNVSVPYAVLETDGHLIKNLQEKPVYTYYSNAGIYLMKSQFLDRVEHNKYLDATDLIEELIAENKKVVVYHLLEYWLDIGRIDDYKKAQEDIHQLNFK